MTGHGEAKQTAEGERRFYAHTVGSHRNRASTALTMADLLRSLADLDAQDRFRNLFLVLDMCGAGAGLKTAVEEVRSHLPAYFLEAESAAQRPRKLAPVAPGRRDVQATDLAGDLRQRAAAPACHHHRSPPRVVALPGSERRPRLPGRRSPSVPVYGLDGRDV
ncbi:hypothetical protein [Microbispora sp. H10836]|uniref:hypothetical protein n=1 Tax=Microbispora sp. H10836 TaxID=2729106 RepID=UPI001473756B|nr:hypothetical protein [Microbispora sp. H10836]